jgi:aromatic ring-opening dioxygenase catalytic subunit (LigB family)
MLDKANPSGRMPTYYLAHGGGPCFFMEWPGDPHAWDSLGGWLRGLRDELPARPSAIVVVSAHWEAATPTVTANAKPGLIYDYRGFPAHTYELQYDAPGSPALAARVQSLLGAAGIGAAADPERGFDHGVFVPFKLIEPEGHIPIVQLSLVRGLDPAEHLAIGRALAPLRDEGVLIAGSGMSYHNMRAMMGQGPIGGEQFDAWLGSTVAADGESRDARLTKWERAPEARDVHPREDHLLPLMVVAGAAGSDPGTTVFHDRLLGAPTSAFRFG